MNKIVKLFIVLVFLTNTLHCDEKKNEKIAFLVNECTLQVPDTYDISISSDLNIRFVLGINAILSDTYDENNSIHFSLRLTDTNASKIVLDDLNKGQENGIKSIIKKDNLLLINFINDDYECIVGDRFYIYSSNKNHNYTKELIEGCNETWHDDMYIEGLETLADKIMKDFSSVLPIALDKDRALKVQKKLESIYNNSTQKE